MYAIESTPLSKIDMPESRKYKGKRYTIVLPQSVADLLEKLAEKEGRSFSQMAARLIEEAIKNKSED